MLAKRVKQRARTLLSIVAVGVLVWVVSAAIYQKVKTFDAITMIGERPFNDLTKTAIDIRQGQSTAFLQIGLLVLTALWGLMIAKKDEARLALSDKPEMVMFISASVLLMVSFLWHYFYLDNLSDAYRLAGKTCSDPAYTCIPDVFDPKIEHLFDFQ